MGKKLIFLDIDGTLTSPGSNVIPDSAFEAVQRTRELGNLVFLCTGRNYSMLEPVLRQGFDGAIGSSGGYIIYGDEVIYDCPMTELQRDIAFTVLKVNGVFRTVECLNASYTDDAFKKFLEENDTAGGNSEFLRWRKQIEESLNIQSMELYQNEPVYKIVFMSPSMEYLREPQIKLSEEFDFCIQEPDQFGIINGEIVNKQFDKGRGIIRVCEYLGVDIKDTYGFGDSMNDLEMVEVVGTSICMENGSPTLKEKVDEICPSVENDGIYQAFKKHDLI